MSNRRSQLALLKYLNFTVEVNRSTYATEFFSLKVWSPPVCECPTA